MPDIAFGHDGKAAIVQTIQLDSDQELHQQMGGFDAELLLDFFTDEVGAYYYNRGLHDAQAILAEKLEDVTDAIYQLEQPAEFCKWRGNRLSFVGAASAASSALARMIPQNQLSS